MDNCLPATGADPLPMLIVFAVLIFSGGILAALALRKRHGGAAMLLLVLPLFAGGLLFASAPTPAVAAACETPSPTPTPTCDPAEAVADATYTGEFLGIEEGLAQMGFTDADVDGYEAVATAIVAIDGAYTAEVSVFAQQVDTITGPIALTPGQVVIEDLVMTFPSEAYWDVTSQFASGTVWVQIDFTYDDGCGGTLSTTVIFEAPFANVA